MRDIHVIIGKGGIDLISEYHPNLNAIKKEPLCVDSQYIAENGKSNPELLLKVYAAKVLASSYDPVIIQKLLKIIDNLQEQLTGHNLPKSQSELILMIAQANVETEKRLAANEGHIDEQILLLLSPKDTQWQKN